MFDTLLARVFGTKHEREIKRLAPRVDQINDLAPDFEALSDEQLQAKTDEFKQRYRDGESLDDLLPEAFATCREASWRVMGMRHFDVQLIGGMVLHQGKIAEMKTGEGKTLTATLAVYLNAISGRGVHVVTVNDYLAQRDSEWMGRIYRWLGLSVGVIVHGLTDEQRREAYGADITYGTNNEFGFDYLRDNMKFDAGDHVQRGHDFAIVDEVDSILVDEARTPLIISGPSEISTDKYYAANQVIPKLEKGETIEGDEPGQRTYTGDFILEEKHRSAWLTEQGEAKVEKALNIGNINELVHYDTKHAIEQGLKAHVVFQRDKDYVVKDGKVVIVDEFTGRLMPGRRWSDGLHQAVEAKEGVTIERENQTLATVTFQNYFRMYSKLAGMTGTADTEAPEFSKIYNLEVVVVPTNQPMIRAEHDDIVYRTVEEKWRNAVADIKECQQRGQPVLVGTISIEKSELLARMLKRRGVPHEVLNAKHHEREARIIAQAGRKGAVTVSTNMAGRGTDILLGGNPEFLAREHLRRKGIAPDHPDNKEMWEKTLEEYRGQTNAEHDEVVELGGLYVLGTERHESRRIDNQLRGRAGRQGDPGQSRFYLSLQDDLMRIFGGHRMQALMLKLGMEEDVPIESGLITKRIEAAQKAVETQHFESRKHVLEYDDVMNKQREAVYSRRREMLEGKDQRNRILELVGDTVGGYVEDRCPERAHPDTYDIAGLHSDIHTHFGMDLKELDLNGLDRQGLADEFTEEICKRYEAKAEEVGVDRMRYTERMIMLQLLDQQWKDHLLSMDHLKEGIGLRGYGQKDPLVEYKKESFHIFQQMMDTLDEETLKVLFHLTIRTPDEESSPGERPAVQLAESAAATNGGQRRAAPDRSLREMDEHAQAARRRNREQLAHAHRAGATAESTSVKQVLRGDKVGRNDPCPCGSGKKYKRCHGSAVAS
jgi:preprotein translocase subunit SecA